MGAHNKYWKQLTVNPGMGELTEPAADYLARKGICIGSEVAYGYDNRVYTVTKIAPRAVVLNLAENKNKGCVVTHDKITLIEKH
jgi:hypothetical protein